MTKHTKNNMTGYYVEQANRLYLSDRADGLAGIPPIWEKCCDELLNWYCSSEAEIQGHLLEEIPEDDILEETSTGYTVEQIPEQEAFASFLQFFTEVWES